VLNNEATTSSLLGHQHGDIRGGWSGLFSIYHRRALLIGVVLGVVQALCGINAVLLYAQKIFVSTGFEASKELMTLLLGAWNCLSTLLAVFVVDRVGRKPLLMLGLVFMAVGLGTLAASEQFLRGIAWSSWISFGAFCVQH
jgi:SP family galactose:H+ symporter-like MFS transporter